MFSTYMYHLILDIKKETHTNSTLYNVIIPKKCTNKIAKPWPVDSK